MNMQRIAAALLVVGMLAGAQRTQAQTAKDVALVAALWPVSEAAAAPYRRELEQGLAERGWVLGKTLTLLHRFADGSTEALAPLAAELLSAKPDAVFALNTPAAFAVRQHTATVAIVVGAAVDPIGAGLIASYARPGSNVTGVTGPMELHVKRLQILREAFPDLRRVGVLYDPDNQSHPAAVSAIREAARAGAFGIVEGPHGKAGDIARAFETMLVQGADGVLVVSDARAFLFRSEIAELAQRGRLPMIFPLREYCDAGGLICYALSLSASTRRGAWFIDRILRGADPATLPVEEPTTFEFVVNLKAARSSGFVLPDAILARADELIE
jgi:putative tryptophan/tyrosine transport system substrate-binding protein